MNIRQSNAYESPQKEDINLIGENYKTNYRKAFDTIGYPTGLIVSGLVVTTGSTSITGSQGIALINGNLCELSGNISLSISGSANTYHIYALSGTVNDTLESRQFVDNKVSRTEITSGVYKRQIDVLTLGFATGLISNSISLGTIVWNGAVITSYSSGARVELLNLDSSLRNAIHPTTGFVFSTTGSISGAITGASGTLNTRISTTTGIINSKINTASGQIDYINTQIPLLYDNASSYYASGTNILTTNTSGTAINSLIIDCIGGMAIVVFRVASCKMSNCQVPITIENSVNGNILIQETMQIDVGGSINHLACISKCIVYFIQNSLISINAKFFNNSAFTTDFEWYFCYSIIKAS